MSLRRRALIALAFTAAFYGLALLVASVLLLVAALAWIAVSRTGYHFTLVRIAAVVTLGCASGAFLIIWSIFPRQAPLHPRHPALEPEAQDRLFAVLREVGRELGQAIPADVYVDLRANAGVSESGGVLRIRGHRYMTLGLPLLQAIRITELKAVVAHELGHYHGGDTRLVPWVYRVAAGVRRIDEQLGGSSRLLHALFFLFGMIFKRVSREIARSQEFAADLLAARATGARPLISALDKADRAAIAFDAYWTSEIQPVLMQGFLPPIAEGFASFIAQPSIVTALNEAVQDQRADAKLRPKIDDSHPHFDERVNALRSIPDGPDTTGEPAAIALVNDIPAIEAALVAAAMNAAPADLERIGWDDVGTRVVLPYWQRQVAALASIAGERAAAELPELILQAEQLGRQLARLGEADAWLSKDQATKIALSALAAAVGVALNRVGWHVEAVPGMPAILRMDIQVIDPAEVLDNLRSGQATAESWHQRCAELGIATASTDGPGLVTGTSSFADPHTLR